MHRSWRYIAVFSITLWAVLPGLAHAQAIQITEIMYDLPGADAGREWVEIKNTTSDPIDLSEWRFHEDDVDHFLRPPEEGDSLILQPGTYAVIVQNHEEFIADNPGFTGMMVDSVFTLTDGGETLAMTNPDGDIVGAATYDPDMGAGGDGNSLQLHDGTWIAAAPTPGEANATVPSSGDDAGTADDGDESRIVILDPRPAPPEIAENISVEAAGKEDAITGIELDFYAQISGIEQRQRSNIDINWSLGNGATASGEEISYTYDHPGEYVVTLRVTDNDDNVFTDTLAVQVREAAFHILDVQLGADGHISLRNDTGRSVDVSGWELASDGDAFNFPPHTILLNAQEMIVPADVSGLSGARATLSLPDGSVVATSTPPNQSSDEHGSGQGEEDTETKSEQSVVTYTAPASQSSTAADESEQPASEDADNADESTTTDPAVRGTSTATSVSPTDALADTAQAAGTDNRPGHESEIFWQWAGMLMLLLVITIGTTLLLRRVSKSTTSPLVQAAKFDIDEINKSKDESLK